MGNCGQQLHHAPNEEIVMDSENEQLLKERLVKEYLAREGLTKKHLTNEALRKKFPSQFDLVNYAIKIAEQMIHGGHMMTVDNEDLTLIIKVLAELNGETNVLATAHSDTVE
jgi:hypothetical protein